MRPRTGAPQPNIQALRSNQRISRAACPDNPLKMDFILTAIGKIDVLWHDRPQSLFVIPVVS